MKDIKLVTTNTDYWSQVGIALSQVTFGAAWAILFLPFDVYKMLMIVLNLITTFGLLLAGALIRSKK